MKMRYLLLLLIPGVGLFTSCEKRELTEDPVGPKTLNELKASETFTWSTGTPVNVSITGLPTVVPVKATLTLSLTDGSVLYSCLHRMHEDLLVDLIIPSTENQLILKYGSVTHTLPVSGGKASFSFIPVIEE